jgi:hypothetical protein
MAMASIPCSFQTSETPLYALLVRSAIFHNIKTKVYIEANLSSHPSRKSHLTYFSCALRNIFANMTMLTLGGEKNG